MFPATIYIERRKRLKAQIGSGVILFLGNDDSPMNYADNPYHFRQDSSFLYFFGLDNPGLAATIDVDEGAECVFGDDLTVDEIVWMGPQPLLQERCRQIGISNTRPRDKLNQVLKKAVQGGRTIHFLPQYRPENILKIQPPCFLAKAIRGASERLIKAVVEQRSIKTREEIKQVEIALDISCEMQMTAIKMARPGVFEREVAAAIEAIAFSKGVRLAFPTIFSIDGEILHNHNYGNLMKDGDIAVSDLGAESPLHYAGDVTRTIPVSGKFSQRQKEIYGIVLNAQEKAIAAMKPGIEFREVHRLACVALASGLKDIGLMKGNVEEAVLAGAHTLFFQCGLGHMLGLDVHDMEALGEDYVGYTDTVKRNPEFGWRSLRLGRALEPGFVVTVEPGLYFIPVLIDRWKAEQKHSSCIDYKMVDKYRDFGGIRIEDDVLVTEDGCKLLGPKIPKMIEEVEALAQGT